MKQTILLMIMAVVLRFAAPIKLKAELAAIYRVTAYCAGKCCCGEFSDGVTASGWKIKPGDKFVAAPKSIPFGTLIDIPGYGDSVPVRDRGGAITDNRLDVFFNDHNDALLWGVQYLKIQIER